MSEWLLFEIAIRYLPVRFRPDQAVAVGATYVRCGEGFRMPSGVGKPPKHEPAALRSWSMGISRFARLGWLRSRLGSAVGGGSVR
jgi:hypothetical protein